MRPPACAVCDTEFAADTGRLVTFAERESDRRWREDAQQSGMVGHPPNVEWFCELHADAAAALATSTIDVALRSLRTPPAPVTDAELPKFAIAPQEITALEVTFRAALPTLVGDAAAEVTATTSRTWTPMDGSHEPDCPYVDIDTTSVVGPLGEAKLVWDRAMWNPDDAARLSLDVTVTPVGGERCTVGVTVGAGFPSGPSTVVRELTVHSGTPSAELRALLAELRG